jgi:cold shock CspA family protein
MPLTGTLRSWNDDRGFGFIAPRDGGRELFVHVSAFPRDGARPTVGESLTYDVGSGKDGRPQAVRVYRQALGRPAEYPRARSPRVRRRSPLAAMLAGVLVAGIAAYVYSAFQKSSAARLSVAQEMPAAAFPAPGVGFRCDGRTRCSQMTSCAEATFFLQNCPGTAMDGNHDGVPCEQQWCTGPFAR